MIRQLTAFFAFSFICVFANAQFFKGDKLVGVNIGNILGNSGSADISFPSGTAGYKSKSNNWTIRLDPNVGWFVSKQTVVGGSLSLNHAYQKVFYNAGGNTFQKDISSQFSIGLGGFTRNYFTANKKYLTFGQMGFNTGISSVKVNGFDFSSDSGGSYKDTYEGESSGGFFLNTSLQLGLTKMLGENTGLDFIVGYSYSYNKNSFKNSTYRDYGNNGSIDNTFISEPTTKFSNHGFILGIGFQIFLKKKNS